MRNSWMILVIVIAASSLVIADPPHTREGSFVGGYGEVIYTGTESSRQAEFRRFILYLGYAFSDNLVFRSELEYEHGTELALEQAYIEWRFSPMVAFRSGLLLIPASRINLYHEPTYFFTNDRPFLDKYLVPSTWREIGVGLSGALGSGWSYYLYLTTGMNSENFSAENFIRKGRQGGGTLEGGEESDGQILFNSLAVTARVTYVLPLQGWLFSGAAYWGGVDNRPDGKTTGASLQILSADIVYEGASLLFSASAAYDWITDVEAVNAANGLTGKNVVARSALGFNATLGINVMYFLSPESEIRLIPYYMIESIQLHWGIPEGGTQNPALNRLYHRIGIALYPHDQVIFKGNLTIQRSADGTADTQWFQLGVGYNF